ncbi:MAG: ribonuclease E inhibitor RraB [Verrucomicrobiota bacterium]
MHTYPDDSDGNVLRGMAESGMNMSAEYEIEFPITSQDEEMAKKIELTLRASGYKNIEIYFDEGELAEGEEMTEENEEFWPSWTVYSKFMMVPEYEKIIQIQHDLDRLVIPLGGKSDGWGLTQE